MKNSLYLFALIVIFLSIFQASALNIKKSNSKPFLTDVLKPAHKTLNHLAKAPKSEILVETTSKANSEAKDPVAEIITGSSDFTHLKDAQGNAIFNFSTLIGNVSSDSANNESILFSFNRTNGVVSLNISSLDSINSTDDSTIAEGCQGFWNARTNQIVQDGSNQYQDNCYIYNPTQQQAITFNQYKSVQAVVAQTSTAYTWVCNFQGQFYIFSVASCEWVPSPVNPAQSPSEAIFFLEKSHSN